MGTRVLIVALAFAAFSAPLGAAPATPPAGTAGTKALLRVVGVSPLTVRGTHFRVREPVRVVVALAQGSNLTRQVRANLTGAFTVSFAGARYDPCGTPPEITARGARTGLVRARGLPRDCAMP